MSRSVATSPNCQFHRIVAPGFSHSQVCAVFGLSHFVVRHSGGTVAERKCRFGHVARHSDFYHLRVIELVDVLRSQATLKEVVRSR